MTREHGFKGRQLPLGSSVVIMPVRCNINWMRENTSEANNHNNRPFPTERIKHRQVPSKSAGFATALKNPPVDFYYI